jgi:hypothetical protein
MIMSPAIVRVILNLHSHGGPEWTRVLDKATVRPTQAVFQGLTTQHLQEAGSGFARWDEGRDAVGGWELSVAS